MEVLGAVTEMLYEKRQSVPVGQVSCWIVYLRVSIEPFQEIIVSPWRSDARYPPLVYLVGQGGGTSLQENQDP